MQPATPDPKDLQRRAMDALKDDSVPPEAKQRIMQLLDQVRQRERAGAPPGGEQPTPQQQPSEPAGQPAPSAPSPQQQPVQMEPQEVTPQAPPQQGFVQMEPQNIVGQVPPPPNVLGETFAMLPKDGATGIAMKSMLQGYFPQEQSQALTEDLSPEEIEQRLGAQRQQEAQLGIDPEAAPHSASHRVAIYAPPVVEVQSAEGEEHPVWVHQEPTVEEFGSMLQAMASWEPTGNEAPDELQRREKAKRKAEAHLITLERDGDEDDAYRSFQDAVWAKVAQEAKRSGQKAIRGAYVPDDTEGMAEHGDEIAARRMVKSPMGSTLYSALDAFSFGQAMPFLAWYNRDMEDSPLGKRLGELGLYNGELAEYKKLRDSSTLGSIGGTAMGLFAPGGAGKAYGKVAQMASKGAAKGERGALGRMAAGAAGGGAIDATAGFARTLAEQLVSGMEVDLGQAAEVGAVEGAMGAGGDVMFGGLGEIGSRVASRYRSGNPDLKAVEGALGDKARGPGDTGERVFGPDLSEENIVGRSMRQGGALEGQVTPTEYASGEAARRVKPTLEKKATEALETLRANAGQYFSTAEAQQEIPVRNSFQVIKELVQKTVGSSDRVRKSAGKAMAEISNFRGYSTRAAAEANANGGLVVNAVDPLVEEMGWKPVVDRAVARVRRPMMEMEGQARSVAAIRSAQGRLKEASDKLRRLESGRGDINKETIERQRRLVQDASERVRRLSSPVSPGEQMWVTIQPKSMNAEAHHAALQDVDSQISYGARSEDAGPGVKRLADGLRADRANWGQGYVDMMEREYELITQMEGTGRVLGMNPREMAGQAVPEALRGSVHDMPLATLGKHLANVYQPGKGHDTELMVRMLDNPKLTKLLKGVRAVTALERMRSGTAVSGRVTTGSTGTFHPIVNFGNLDKLIYGRGRALERAYLEGNMPKAARSLLQPEARDFIQNASSGLMEGLMKALETKETEDVSAND